MGANDTHGTFSEAQEGLFHSLADQVLPDHVKCHSLANAAQVQLDVLLAEVQSACRGVEVQQVHAVAATPRTLGDIERARGQAMMAPAGLEHLP